MGSGTAYPAPDQYSSHQKMSERRSNSRERNAFRATIGREPRMSSSERNAAPTPGPDNYLIKSFKTIGDEGGTHVPFGKAMRPISAKPGQVRHVIMPGPQDYKVINPDVFLKRSSVIPSCTFQKSQREGS